MLARKIHLQRVYVGVSEDLRFADVFQLVVRMDWITVPLLNDRHDVRLISLMQHRLRILLAAIYTWRILVVMEEHSWVSLGALKEAWITAPRSSDFLRAM